MSRTLTDTAEQTTYLRPLLRRVRSAETEAELRQLTGLSRAALIARTKDQAKGRALSKEALVTIVRTLLLRGDRDAADQVFLEIVQRISGAIANKLSLWSSLNRSDFEDVRQSVIVGLLEYIYSLEPGEELWECNFKTCFDLRIYTVLASLTRSKVETISTTVESDDESIEDADLPDPSAEKDLQAFEVREALSHLNKFDIKVGKAFYLTVFGDLTEKETAAILDVSERTIRNWLVIARTELRRYYAES